ncbi:universal stress protein [Roseomonas xinghualingensis]|uniref:universal stress protein n=1 Tax=Roseomonas xinghualingensis TaxID=2986475 RepID=UPI0021F20924|nr:universal stress protein [Roseomonas sp. SXEYE001]MCV4209631.1 universal stress protein [Roseomonas sp. SXEYE001]
MQGYKSILVHVTTEEGAAARLTLAADLAERFDAHLIGLGAGCINLPIEPLGDGAAAAMLIDIETGELKAELHAAEQRFHDTVGSATGTASAKVEWRAFQEFPATALAREARAADLIILGPEWTPANSNFNTAANPGDVLLRAGRPVLLVPSAAVTSPPSRIIVAWKETREAQRAVLDALPLMQGAEQVSVLEICEDEREIEAATARVTDVARYLIRHGIGAEGSACRRQEATFANQIELAAQAQSADLIVLGGYGHARLREWVFGGVTRDLLKRSKYCCLLSH